MRKNKSVNNIIKIVFLISLLSAFSFSTKNILLYYQNKTFSDGHTLLNNFNRPKSQNGDLIMDNGHLKIELNGSLLENPTGAIFSRVTSPYHNNLIIEPEEIGEPDNCASSGGQDGSESYAATDMLVLTNLTYNNAIGYSIITNRSTSQYDIRWNTTVILPNNEDYFLVSIEIENMDNEQVTIDEISSHIHDGINIFSYIKAQLGDDTYPNSASNDNLFIYGLGDVAFVGTTYWISHSASSTKPFYTLYDSNNGDAITVGYLEGSTSPNQIISFYRYDSSSPIAANIDFTVSAAYIPVGNKYNYTFFVAVHNNTVNDGSSIYDSIKGNYLSYMNLNSTEDSQAPNIVINSPSGESFSSAPTMDIDFTDDTSLNSAYYKIDSYSPIGLDTDGWIPIFTDFGGSSFTNDFVMNSSVWDNLPDGTHTVYFKVWDQYNNVNDGSSPSWSFIKETSNLTNSLDSPILYEITPNIDEDGNIILNWSIVNNAAFYKVYRSNTSFTNVSNMSPIANVSSTVYIDSGLTNGTYYYGIIAQNGSQCSLLSNIESVTVLILPSSEDTSEESNTSNNNSEEPVVLLNETYSLQVGENMIKVYNSANKLRMVLSVTILWHSTSVEIIEYNPAKAPIRGLDDVGYLFVVQFADSEYIKNKNFLITFYYELNDFATGTSPDDLQLWISSGSDSYGSYPLSLEDWQQSNSIKMNSSDSSLTSDNSLPTCYFAIVASQPQQSNDTQLDEPFNSVPSYPLMSLSISSIMIVLVLYNFERKKHYSKKLQIAK